MKPNLNTAIAFTTWIPLQKKMNNSMRYIVSISIHILYFANVLCSQNDFCETYLHFNTYSQHTIDSLSSYVGLSMAIKQHIRQKALHHHQLYLQYYKNGDRRVARKQNQLCRKLNRGFIDYHNYFMQMPPDLESDFLTNGITKIDSFVLFPHLSFHFNPFIRRWTTINIPDSLMARSIITENYEDVYARLDESKHPDLRRTRFTDILKDKNNTVYHYDNTCIFSPLYVEIPANTFHDTIRYALYKFHELSNKTVGLVAVNIADSSDIHFLAGPFMPLGFDVPINKFIDQLAQRSMKDPIHSYWASQEYIKYYKLDESFDFTYFNGVLEYARLIASHFMYLPRSSHLLEYRNGYYTVSVASGLPLLFDEDKNFCKRIIAKPGEWQGRSRSYREVFRGLTVPPYLLCGDFNGRVVSKMHFRINPETGDVQMKIAERSNIRRIPVCTE